MNIEAPRSPSFFDSHVQRCEGILTGDVGIGTVVGKLRAVLEREDPGKRPAILKRAAIRERAPFRDLAAQAIDRTLPAVEHDAPRSGLDVNRGLLDFVSLVSPNIRLRARAGSGKSTAIVIKCDFLVNGLGVPPGAIQILTFNRSAVDDLVSKLHATLGPETGGRIGVNTFHSLAYHVLKSFPETRERTLVFREEDRSQKDQLSDLERTVRAETTPRDLKAYKDRYEGTTFGFMTKFPDFDRSVREFVTGASSLYRARRGTPGRAKRTPVTSHLSRVVEAYEKRLDETGVFDGEAGMREAARILSGAEDIPRFNRLTGALQFLFVDEYQDFSAAFEELTQGVMARNPDCVLNAVGDDWQSINAFMGADLSFFDGFKTRYPAALNLPLHTNWRCGRRIVELGNRVMKPDTGHEAVAGLSREGRIRVKTGDISQFGRKKEEWHEEARAFLERQVATMARHAWEEDARAGRAPGSMVLLAARNKPFGRSIGAFARAIDSPEGASVEASTSHGSKGREWDHVILLDGISSLYPGEHPADPVQRDMISRDEKDAEGHRLLYVAVTRAKRSLAILAPTDLHPRLEAARGLGAL